MSQLRSGGAGRCRPATLPPSFHRQFLKPSRQISIFQTLFPRQPLGSRQHQPFEAVEVRQLPQFVPHRLHHVRVPARVGSQTHRGERRKFRRLQSSSGSREGKVLGAGGRNTQRLRPPPKLAVQPKSASTWLLAINKIWAKPAWALSARTGRTLLQQKVMGKGDPQPVSGAF